MHRLHVPERADWIQRMKMRGFDYYMTGGNRYWDEGICYILTETEATSLRRISGELHAMCLDAVQHVIDKNLFDLFRIPREIVPKIIASWEQNDPWIYGRFDLAYDGKRPPKLLEYNADTPTSLLESAFVQADWLHDAQNMGFIPANAKQFNDIARSFRAAWGRFAPKLAPRAPVFFSCLYETTIPTPARNTEDIQNCACLALLCEDAGLTTRAEDIRALTWNGQNLTNSQGEPIQSLFKLYPWEWALHDDFAPLLQSDLFTVIEPAWKMILSNKAILPLLWQLFPDHPNLLPASFDENALPTPYVKKPIFSREGANISIVTDDTIHTTDGNYGAEGYIYQAYAPLFESDERYAVIGSWISSEIPHADLNPSALWRDKGGMPCGVGVREDWGPITRNTSRFLPHYIL